MMLSQEINITLIKTANAINTAMPAINDAAAEGKSPRRFRYNQGRPVVKESVELPLYY